MSNRPMISKSVSVRNAVFAYVSVCCKVLADKPALVKSGEAQGTLGHWRCSSCRKACKVSVADKAQYTPAKVEPVQQETVTL